MIDATRMAAASVKLLGKVFKRGLFAFGRIIPNRIPVNFENMAERVFKTERAAMAGIAVNPPDYLIFARSE